LTRGSISPGANLFSTSRDARWHPGADAPPLSYRGIGERAFTSGCSLGIPLSKRCHFLHLVDAAIMSSRRRSSARKIWIDDALGGTARCRLGALCQRGVAAIDVAPVYAVGLQADWIVRIIRLGSNRRRRQNRCDRQNRHFWNAHRPSFGISVARTFTVRAQISCASRPPVKSRSRVGSVVTRLLPDSASYSTMTR
jgi:hypothetical protein